MRIELGEIELALKDQVSISEAVVLVRDEEKGDPKLVAYISGSEALPTSKQLRDFVKSKLPDYMVPNIIVPLTSLPVTVHGKLDRAALPWPVKREAEETKKSQVKDSKGPAWEEVLGGLIECFERVLDITGIKAEDDLFDLGATSLTMVQIVDQIDQLYGISVPVDVFLDDPSIGAVARYLGQELGIQFDSAGADQGESLADTTAEFEVAKIRKSECSIELLDVGFKETAYINNLFTQAFTGESISFTLFSQFLSVLKGANIGGRLKYLHPSSGGLNAVQIYVYIKRDRVEGIQEGIYYYHPEEHGLYGVTRDPEMDQSSFCEVDRALFDQACFSLFLIAELRAIEPIYQESSPMLVTLDAGYMGQLLLSRKREFNLGLSVASVVNFEKISNVFKLNKSHRLIHCLLGGVGKSSETKRVEHECKAGMADSVGQIGRRKAPDISSSFSRRFHDEARSKEAEELTLTPEQLEKFHQEHAHIRRFSTRTSRVKLASFDFPESDYRLRSCKREYLDKSIPFAQFSKFLSLLKPQDIDSIPHYLYPSLTGDHGIQVYVAVKENGVEGIDEGIYQYHPLRHALIPISSNAFDVLKASYTPFNRRHYQKAQFCLFLINSGSFPEACAEEEGVYYALLESGYMGQLLTDKQAEFDLGICPIGGIRFDRIRAHFKVSKEAELLHSFVGGSFELSLPKHRDCLEVGRGGSEQEMEVSGSDDVGRSSPTEKGDSAEEGEGGFCSDIAIVGISGRYPGATTMADFWQNLRDGTDSFREAPNRRNLLWKDSATHDATGACIPSKRGGFLEDIDCFDHLLFCISPLEARAMDPQERLFLEVTWECLENSGYTAESLVCGSGKVGVFVGAMWNDYQNLGCDSSTDSPVVQAGSFHSSIANRVSYFFNFIGPSIAVDTSCSSAMTAIHFACESLKKGECGAAAVGGVNIMSHPYHQELLSALDLISETGECHPFGAAATGWVPGEGVGVFLLKVKEDAERDCDYIHGIIKGTAISHSGKTARYGAPNSKIQEESILHALTSAKVSVDAISYVEAGAPGASLADASE